MSETASSRRRHSYSHLIVPGAKDSDSSSKHENSRSEAHLPTFLLEKLTKFVGTPSFFLEVPSKKAEAPSKKVGVSSYFLEAPTFLLGVPSFFLEVFQFFARNSKKKARNFNLFTGKPDKICQKSGLRDRNFAFGSRFAMGAPLCQYRLR